MGGRPCTNISLEKKVSNQDNRRLFVGMAMAVESHRTKLERLAPVHGHGSVGAKACARVCTTFLVSLTNFPISKGSR